VSFQNTSTLQHFKGSNYFYVVILSCILLTNCEHARYFLSRHATLHLRLVKNKYPNTIRSGKTKGNEHITYGFMWDLRFPKWCCWRFNSYGMWHCVVWLVIPVFEGLKTPSSSMSCSFIQTMKSLQSFRTLETTDPVTQHHTQMTWTFNLSCSSYATEARLLWKFQSRRQILLRLCAAASVCP
jgi:hypothetical protein